MEEISVTGCLNKLGEEKPISKWSFRAKSPNPNTPLSEFIQKIQTNHGIGDRCQEVGITSYKIKLSYKYMKPEQEWPKGRLFSIDTQEEFEMAVPLMKMSADYELVGKISICPW